MLSLGVFVAIPLGGASYSLRYVEILLIILLFFIGIKNLNKDSKIKLSNGEKINYTLFFMFFLYSLMTFFWSSKPTTALSGSIVFFFALLALVVSNYYLSRDPKIFVVANRIFIFSLFVQISFSMYQVIGAHGLHFYALKESSNTLIGNSNAVSFYFTFSLLFEFISKEKKWGIFTLINAIGLALTLSRGAFVTLAICLVIYLLISLFSKKIKIAQILVTISVMGILFYLFIQYTAPGIELWSGLQNGLSANSVGTRQNLWSDSLKQIIQKPYGDGVIWENDPHNIIIRVTRDLGVLFGPIFIVIIGYPLYYFIKISTYQFSNKSIAVLIAYLSIFIHAMIEIFYLTSHTIIYTIFVLTYLNKLIRNEKKLLAERKEKQKLVETVGTF